MWNVLGKLPMQRCRSTAWLYGILLKYSSAFILQLKYAWKIVSNPFLDDAVEGRFNQSHCICCACCSYIWTSQHISSFIQFKLDPIWSDCKKNKLFPRSRSFVHINLCLVTWNIHIPFLSRWLRFLSSCANMVIMFYIHFSRLFMFIVPAGAKQKRNAFCVA